MNFTTFAYSCKVGALCKYSLSSDLYSSSSSSSSSSHGIDPTSIAFDLASSSDEEDDL